MATPPDFVAGNVLQAAQLNQIGMWLVKTQTIGSAVSSVAVTNAFSADYEHYRIVLHGGAGSTNQGIALQLGASTASYYFAGSAFNYNSNNLAYIRTNNGASFGDVGYSGTSFNHLDCMVYSPFTTTRTGIVQAGAITTDTAGSARNGGAGFHNVAASYTDFTLIVAGTMTGGTIYVYGMRD